MPKFFQFHLKLMLVGALELVSCHDTHDVKWYGLLLSKSQSLREANRCTASHTTYCMMPVSINCGLLERSEQAV